MRPHGLGDDFDVQRKYDGHAVNVNARAPSSMVGRAQGHVVSARAFVKILHVDICVLWNPPHDRS